MTTSIFRRVATTTLFILLLLVTFGKSQAQSHDLSYFAGRWKFQIYFTGNETKAPDLSAEWNVAIGLDSTLCLMGHVVLNGGVFTRELMSWNPKDHHYTRTITTNTGSYIVMPNPGFRDKEITWTGTEYSPSGKNQLKETITIVSDNEFVARFYYRSGDPWREAQREVLNRISTKD